MSIFRDLDTLDRVIQAASDKYNEYAARETWNLPTDLGYLFHAADRARTAADQALLAARHDGESARMAPVELLVANAVTTASVFATAATEYETRRAAIAAQVDDEAGRLGRLAVQMNTLADKGMLPAAVVRLMRGAQEVLAEARRTGDAEELHTLMTAVGGLFVAVAQAEKAAK